MIKHDLSWHRPIKYDFCAVQYVFKELTFHNTTKVSSLKTHRTMVNVCVPLNGMS